MTEKINIKIFLLTLATITYYASAIDPKPLKDATIIAEKKTITTGLVDEAVTKYLEKPRFTKIGLADFFKFQFNTALYAQFLPRSFIHLADFLDYANTTKKPASFVIKVFNIFDQRIKECSWVNSYALLALMEEFLVRLPQYCEASDEEERAMQIKNELHKMYEKHKDSILNDKPEAFFEHASKAIDTVIRPAQDAMDTLELQMRVSKFLENAIQKIIWSPSEQLEIWKSTCAIASKLHNLYTAGILPSLDDLNILTWTLIYRFSYFIDCAGSQLTTDLFKQMLEDTQLNKISVFSIEEQEHFLLPKKQFIEEIATRGQAKAAAAASGIYVDGII